MLYRLICACLVVFASFVNAPLVADQQEWLECPISKQFLAVFDLSAKKLSECEELVTYLRARGVDDETTMMFLYYKDLYHIAHALSLLFEQNSAVVLQRFLGEHYYLIEDYMTYYDIHIDHVGRELFGPISFYLPLLEEIAPELGLTLTKQLIFPSTQVVKVLQEHDPEVKGVTIGRIYFKSHYSGLVRCIELFQASLPDGTYPQHVSATEERFSLLTSTKTASAQTPIDHLSVELTAVEQVQNVHRRIQQVSSETLIPYQKEVSHNPGDGSTQTKVLIRDSIEAPFNKIVEFVHYSQSD